MIKPENAMQKVRKFSVKAPNRGLWGGLVRGMASSNEAFHTLVLTYPSSYHTGLRSDVEALRSDVQRAKGKLARELYKSAEFTEAG